jgi:hypothetical protein
MATPELRSVQVAPTEVSIVLDPSLHVLVRPRDGPKVPQPRVTNNRACCCAISGQEDVGDCVVVEKDQVKAAPPEVEAGGAE